MKKLWMLAIIAGVILPLNAATAPNNLYMPQDVGWGWNFSAPPAMAHDGSKFSYMLEGSDNTKDLFFFISSKTADNWDGYTGTDFYGLYAFESDKSDATADGVLTTGNYTMYNYGTLKHCYKLARGTKYVVTMDFSGTNAAMNIVDGNAVPEHLYFPYDNGSGWKFSDAPEFTKSGQKFTYAIKSDTPIYFFVSRDRRSTWDRMVDDNAGVSYMVSGESHEGGNKILDPVTYNITLYGSCKRCYQLASGDYVITVDFSSGSPTMAISKDGQEPGPAPVPGTTAMPEKYTGVMLQGFFWDSYDDTKWTTLTEKAYDYSKYFDLIWVPNSGQADGGMGYMPCYWYTNHNSAFGSEDELLAMNSLMNDLNTAMIEDVVVNHRNGYMSWYKFPVEEYNGVTYELGLDAICSNDGMASAEGQPKPTGAPDTGDLFDGCRDLDHTNPHVQDGIMAYLDCLHNKYGYSGWRFDMVKGYGAQYAGMYARSAGMKYAVGEYWDGYDNITNWIKGTDFSCSAFDFPLHDAFQAAFDGSPQDLTKLSWKRYGELDQPAGLIHMDGFTRYAVTFVDNHDTYREEYQRVDNEQLAANAFILTHPGTPCVFLQHWLDYTDAIARMIDIRKAVGIHNQSEVQVLKCTNNCYAARVTGLNGDLIVKVGSDMEFNVTTPGYSIATSGNNYCIWTATPVSDSSTLTISTTEGISAVYANICATNTREGDYIVYTLDGTNPTPARGTRINPTATTASLRAAKVSGTVTVENPATLRAALFSADNKMRTSLVEKEIRAIPTSIISVTEPDATVRYDAASASLVISGIELPSVQVYNPAGVLVGTSANLVSLTPGIYLYRITDSATGHTFTGRFCR